MAQLMPGAMAPGPRAPAVIHRARGVQTCCDLEQAQPIQGPSQLPRRQMHTAHTFFTQPEGTATATPRPKCLAPIAQRQ
eukprot:CAMPEP_0119117880 /NCGR_PEP_ID=MMETSP1180-20130426/53088_1 /TAXON_ID=3052 ORGANISM="Chlamydomonas cf sp, Strain CCMP681" /NCGR_SAMPLE_ID=MMETSP1180 /ASSEMBLY_ACC=CAM_ASM_000741 /LENGTH=78 /DNA_ID=CAMNT_0007107191 /DNA_START=800 /DNA_END=1036 /DNA_ORIENTATION=+